MTADDRDRVRKAVAADRQAKLIDHLEAEAKASRKERARLMRELARVRKSRDLWYLRATGNDPSQGRGAARFKEAV